MPLDAAMLANDMTQLAQETWHKVDSGDRQGLRFREDSLTDHNLWTLDQQHQALRVHRFDQSREKSTGADWEWWVGSQRSGWVCLRIQAKRVDALSYRQLGHPGQRDDEYQYDTLLRSCAAEPYATYALHVFYNGWDGARFGSPWPPGIPCLRCLSACRAGACTHAHMPAETFGCAVAATSVVKAIHESGPRRNRLVRSYLPYSLPWAELFGFWEDLEDPAPPISGWLPSSGDPVGWTETHLLDYLQAVLETLSAPDDASDFWSSVVALGRDGAFPARRPELPDYVDAVRRAGDRLVQPSQLSLPAAGRVIVADTAAEPRDPDRPRSRG